ncbi:hypothetical protein K227x_14870 [Rubripirellula lacrimiformis]|uniref:Uncharacterized protein n=1 Tax=Rubripirellula lacrimiformis TaxID=1930273 RepID=A0A517N7J2_9BACT|nr:hypothetical protein [Rubripirellula lacrimiformis]QDT03107.1 hypothetical protein K227x_14870 [Rubripirellula lacrimiformis]
MQANTHITPPGPEKFTLPVPPTFNTKDAWFSAGSLLVFFVASLLAIINLPDLPLWVGAPFWFTAFGSGIGFLYETWLLIRNAPYQLLGTAMGRFIQTIRLGNIAFVFGSVYLAYGLVTLGAFGHSGWVTALVGTVTGFLLILFLFRGPQEIGAATLTVGLIALLILMFASSGLQGGVWGRTALAVAAIGLYATTFIGSQTPRRSTVFHLVATVVVALLYFGLRTEFDASAEAHQGIIGIGLRLLVSIPAGMALAFYLLPQTWAMFRSMISGATWPYFYLFIAGGMRVPRPERLGELYAGRESELQPLGLLPYYIAHPRNLTHPVSVPCLDEALTLKVHAFGMITRLVKFAFGAASMVNRVFPIANIDVPLRLKPRMEPWSDGSNYWPKQFLQRIYLPTLGWFSIESGVRGPGFQPTPPTVLEAYSQGQLLAFLVEYGTAGTFIQPIIRDGKQAFVMDLSFFEKYETKADYESYGGVAYFEIDDANHCLKLTHVQAPKSDIELSVDPTDARFRHAEDMILATVYFYVVSGKHLVEIHMGLNLIEVALFNSFDAKRQWFHPVRLALYPHLFAHELAEELTTQNLLEDNAVFPQIFATTNASLMRHLNDRFGEYELAEDEDFERREKVLLAGRDGQALENVLPRSSLVWEKQYAAIWLEYATSLVEAVYTSDANVASDECVQVLFANLAATYAQPLPNRFDQLKTRSGLARFIADMMHHLIIRHEVYGTSGVRLALDPRINKVQVPKDGGTYGVDEWRSLACVAMATSRVRYTLLATDYKNVFEDLKDPEVNQKYRDAHDRMKSQLEALEAEFTSDEIENYNTLRLLPSELDIGAGY